MKKRKIRRPLPSIAAPVTEREVETTAWQSAKGYTLICEMPPEHLQNAIARLKARGCTPLGGTNPLRTIDLMQLALEMHQRALQRKLGALLCRP